MGKREKIYIFLFNLCSGLIKKIEKVPEVGFPKFALFWFFPKVTPSLFWSTPIG
jgi:hypothetical protein